MDPAIIVKFVRREMRESLYQARKRLKSITTADFDFSVDKKIFINESLTPRNKELFKVCLRKTTATSSCGLMLGRSS